MAKGSMMLFVVLFATVGWPQSTPKKYPWEVEGTSCAKGLTFCWYGSERVSDPQVTAYGTRWVSQDKEEKLLEWVTEVRCLKSLNVCVLARSEKRREGTLTYIELYRIQEWSELQIRAVAEDAFPPYTECTIDSLLLNRADASVSRLSVPSVAGTIGPCTLIAKPKTTMYKLELGFTYPRDKQ